jgi:hypothetical protein
MGEDTIEQNTGIKPRAARKLLEETIKKFVPRSDGDLSFSGQPSWDEFALLKHLSTIIVMKRGFDGKQLIEDFAHVLQRNKALFSDEDIGFLKAPLSLYAISKMHGTTLALSKTDQIGLAITALDGGPMSIGIDIRSVGYTWVPSWFFSSRLSAKDHCEPSLVAHPLPWNFAVELNQTLKLERLG